MGDAARLDRCIRCAYNVNVSYEWDREKQRQNLRKHSVEFGDAVSALEDDDALTSSDDDSDEEDRFVTLGADLFGRILVVVYMAGRCGSPHFGAKGDPPRAKAVRRTMMRREYDFSKAKRGAIVPVDKGKTRITIRLDMDILDWFRDQANQAGGGNYQTMLNSALREYVHDRK